MGQLRNAYNGQDVEWNDEGEFVRGEGLLKAQYINVIFRVTEENDFGSGAGSGASNYDDEDDTEGGDDREENGSGMSEYDPSSFGTTSTTTHQEPHPTAGVDVGHTGGVVPAEHDKKNREDDAAANAVSPSSSTGRPVVHPEKEAAEDEDQTVNVLRGVDGDERVVPQEPKSGTGTETTSGSAGGQPEMSITRAVVTYFFPIFMAWFGGIFSVLL